MPGYSLLEHERRVPHATIRERGAQIREWYSRGNGKGVVFLVDAKTEDEARAIMETLPLAKEQMMDHEYIPIGPLIPLRALPGQGTQNN